MTLGGSGAVQTAVIVVAAGILTIIAYCDVLTRRIPNMLSVTVMALALVRIILVGNPVAVTHTLAAGTVIFIATFLLFWRGAIGGGDAKLITAMALLVGYQNLIGFLFLMSLFGGVLALAALAQDKLRPRLVRLSPGANRRSLVEATQTVPEEPTVPYGLAIAAAGAIMLIIAG
jgi:prepilin peptidase CpaA